MPLSRGRRVITRWSPTSGYPFCSRLSYPLLANFFNRNSNITMQTPLLLLIRVDYPPAKRRRGLAGSIVSTALSAAVIGTAVGLTVYRL